ncbi:UDP-glucuronosyltransferase 2A1-like [Amphiura filiformis]|uniref:UDP-glucuronosyltransferase 2A1-like n=1 Tax=Amphiura filiformis TaxID=82378 RepID=UPI003B20D75E
MAHNFTQCLLVFIVWNILYLQTISTSNILVVPMESDGSHYFVMKSIADELVSRGHHVTMLLNGIYKDKVTAKSSPGIQMEFFKSNFTLQDHEDFLTGMTNAGLRGEYFSYFMENLDEFMARTVADCHNILYDVAFMSRLKNSNFQVALVDFGFECPLLQLLKRDIGLPYIAVSALLALPSYMMISNRKPYNPAYMPELMIGSFDHKMFFYDRLINTLLGLLLNIMTVAIDHPLEETFSQFGIPNELLRHADADLWLMNTHFAFDFPRPFLPNSKPVGGLTTQPAKSLTKDLEEFVHSSGEHGVVLFSMGSYAKGVNADIAAMFAGAFAQIPEKVIWKLNGQPSATLSDNIKVMDWVPQNDLLAHSQVKAFVTHCGMNGVWEAVYHGVPMVAIPLFGDQPDNAQRIESRGIGVRVDVTTLTSDLLTQAIRIVIDEPSYKTNAKKLSALFRDTPRTPVQQAADWSEYIIRHGDARHLRSAALDLNLIQYFLLDVLLCLCLGVLMFSIIMFCFCRICFKGCSKVCARGTKVKTQ